MGVRGAAAGREAAVPRGVRPYLTERREKAAAADREVLVCGDWNMAAAEADI
jgi:exonuclease III